jgi:predicted adenylyl cyclase CyaB
MNSPPDDNRPNDQRRCNVELKARLPSLDAAREIAQSLATDQLPDQRQVDTYFRCHQGRLKLREIDGAPAQLISYQRPDTTAAKPSRYYLIDVPDPATMLQGLTEALGILVRVEKYRQIYFYKNVRIHLDQVQRLGTFLEFEAVLEREEQIEQGEAVLARLQAQFTIRGEDLLTSSYSDMLIDAGEGKGLSWS